MEKKKINTSLVYAIIGVALLIVVVSGSAYAYYVASATANNITGSAAGGGLELTVTKKSTSASGNLIPIDLNAATLTSAAKGYGNSGGFDATKSCIDKNGYSVCQVYEVTLRNSSTNTVKYNIGVTSLSGTSTPNIDVVKMDSNTSVTAATSIKGSSTGITSADSYTANQTKTYYIMVFIKNINSVQNDSGTFNGVVTATSSTGGQLKADFS